MKIASLWICAVLAATPVSADPALDALVAAYPDHLLSHDGKTLVWKDGTRMPVSDGRAGKSFEELLNEPSVVDQFAIPYPLGTRLTVPLVNEDSGRIRNEAFFRKMYGDCRNGEVKGKLKPVAFLAAQGGNTVMVTTVNGVADRLAAVVRDLERLPPQTLKNLVPSAGSYYCRPIAGTNRLSMHAYGAAIDLNARSGDYWLWTKSKEGKFSWRNRVPLEVVEVFERHGFIWGGKWYHYDTLHFEYRPEIIALAKQGWPRKKQ